MKEINIKPLRKNKESILSDVEYHAKLNTRQSSSAFLSSKKLKDGLESFKSDKNLLEQFTTTKFSFNTKRFGDYVCNVLKITIFISQDMMTQQLQMIYQCRQTILQCNHIYSFKEEIS
ncbi:MAG: hypothetical protein IPG39_22190 [Bacteroidetes bacterium]|nr:hypothetical protein [Bacteroidota bacterium]